MTDCADVCDAVIERLLALGFEIDLDEQNHDAILEALSDVAFVREHDPEEKETIGMGVQHTVCGGVEARSRGAV